MFLYPFVIFLQASQLDRSTAPAVRSETAPLLGCAFSLFFPFVFLRFIFRCTFALVSFPYAHCLPYTFFCVVIPTAERLSPRISDQENRLLHGERGGSGSGADDEETGLRQGEVFFGCISFLILLLLVWFGFVDLCRYAVFVRLLVVSFWAYFVFLFFALLRVQCVGRHDRD